MNDEKWTVKLGERGPSKYMVQEGQELDDLDEIAEKLGTSKEDLLKGDKIKDIHVKEIKIRHCWKKVVNSVQFVYEVATDEETYSVDGHEHGSSINIEGEEIKKATVRLEPGEYILGITVTDPNIIGPKKKIEALSFSTYKPSTNQIKNYGEYGGDGCGGAVWFEIQAADGKACSCFYGRSDNNRLFALGMYEGEIVKQWKEKITNLEKDLDKVKKENTNLKTEKTDLEQLNKATHESLEKVYNCWNGATIIGRERQDEVLGVKWAEKLQEKKTIQEVRGEEARLIKKITDEEKKERGNQRKYEGEIQIEIDKANNFISELDLTAEGSNNLLEKLRTFRDKWGFSPNLAEQYAFLNKNQGNVISKLIRELQTKIRAEEAIRLITRSLNQEPQLQGYDLGDRYANFVSTLRQMNNQEKINEYENEVLIISAPTSFQPIRPIRARLNRLINTANEILDSSNNSPEVQQNRKRTLNILIELEEFRNSSRQTNESVWLNYINRRTEVNRLTNLTSGTLYQVVRKQASDRLTKRKELLAKQGIVVSESEFSNYQLRINRANSQELQDQKYENEFLDKTLERQRIQPQIQQNNS